MADFNPGSIEQTDLLEGWILKMDRASNSKGVGIRIVLTTLEESIIEQSFTLEIKNFYTNKINDKWYPKSEAEFPAKGSKTSP